MIGEFISTRYQEETVLDVVEKDDLLSIHNSVCISYLFKKTVCLNPLVQKKVTVLKNNDS